MPPLTSATTNSRGSGRDRPQRIVSADLLAGERIPPKKLYRLFLPRLLRNPRLRRPEADKAKKHGLFTCLEGGLLSQ